MAEASRRLAARARIDAILTRIDAQFHERQREATQTADARRYTLYGGSRGPGKSYWLRWYALRQVLQWARAGVRGVQATIFCETYRELIDRQVSKVQTEFPNELGEVKDSTKAGFGFYLAPEFGGGVLSFRNLDDPTKYQSFESALIGIDELTKSPARTFNILRASMRWPGVSRTQFIAATNPNGRHAEWVRDYWIEHRLPPELKPQADEFAFVKALPRDNPHLDESYWQELDTLPEVWRKAWRDGDWYATAEGIVYAEFTHGNIVPVEYDPALTLELAFDDGYIDPRVVLFIQKTGAEIRVIDELHQTKTLDDVSVRDVLARCVAFAGRDLPDGWAGMTLRDASAWALANGVQLPEIAIGGSESVQLMRRFREANIPARGGTHEIVEGIRVVRQLICDGHGYRALRVNPRCANLIKEFTQGYRYPEGAKRDNEKPEDANNHTADALRVWCWMRAR